MDKQSKSNKIAIAILVIVGAVVLGFLNYYFIQRGKVFIRVTDAKELIGSWQDKYSARLTFNFDETGLLIGTATDGSIFHISKYFITNDTLHTMNSAGKIFNESIRLSKDKKKIYFEDATNVIYYKKANEGKNYHIVKDASEIIGGWGYATNNLVQGYLFTKESELVMFLGNTPVFVLSFGITNNVFYTFKDGTTNTDGFPILLSKDKTKMYLFGWADKSYVKILDENNNLIPQK